MKNAPGHVSMERAQKSPCTKPCSSNPMRSAAGALGSPGIVMISPQIATTNPAPADSLTSRIGSTWPSGAPSRVGSAEKEYCVFAMQTGRLP